jgi:hypothetical protein
MAVVARADPPSTSSKTDIVEMSNGDRLICEIKELVEGQLRLSTDGLSTVYATWEKVVRIESTQRFQVHLTSGALLYGTLKAAAEPRRVVVAIDGGDQELALPEVTGLEPIRSSFWGRLDGSLGFGGSYSRASGVLQLNPSMSLVQTRPGFQTQLDATATLTRQEGKADATRALATLTYGRNIADHWLVVATGSVERNTELDLAYRLLAGAGMARILVSSPRSQFLVALGVAGTQDTPLEGESTTEAEGIFTLRWNYFAHAYPKTRVTATFSLYPGLSDWGRLRTNLDIQARREIVRDFFIALTFYNSTDNRPASGVSAKNDYGATVGIEWTF